MDVVERTRKVEVKLGMTLLGLIISSILYGIALTQTYTYFQRFRRDRLLTRFLVVAICLLDTASVFLVGHACWYYLVTTQAISVSVWSLNAELVISMFISGISEMFLAYRVWMLSGKKLWLSVVIVGLALLHFTSGQVSAIQFLELKRFARFQSVKVPSILRLTSAALCDTGIAVALCHFLRKKRTGFKRTDRVIDYLILFSINSGLLTSVASIACLITYLVVPKTWVYLALCFLISRLYANTFLCSLNSRKLLLDALDGDEFSAEVHVPKYYPKPRSQIFSRPFPEVPTQIDVYVVQETITEVDDLRVSTLFSSLR
ncbi:hypothetical protein BDN72DRAFT_401474 [Pluteus cervinus]|uniref:Uncharacterized protein n=1 Tax=Pluteus cervinus TaxID=181527 RepID=A0ACD3B1I4_9AGAR|nr:hypothetical protein BDN72DRAFT_401474 [Pluteus cervinus]